MYAFWKSRYFIGGVQNIRIDVPTFGAVHFFLSSPPCVGMRFLCLWTPLRRARAVRAFSCALPWWPESRLMTPLMYYSWFWRRCYYNPSAVHIHPHVCRSYFAFACSVFCSFDVHIFCSAHLDNHVLQLTVLCLFDFGWFGIDHTSAHPSQT